MGCGRVADGEAVFDDVLVSGNIESANLCPAGIFLAQRHAERGSRRFSDGSSATATLSRGLIRINLLIPLPQPLQSLFRGALGEDGVQRSGDGSLKARKLGGQVAAPENRRWSARRARFPQPACRHARKEVEHKLIVGNRILVARGANAHEWSRLPSPCAVKAMNAAMEKVRIFGRACLRFTYS